MDFQAVSSIFNRALSYTFSKKKLLFVFSVLALSGLLVVFFRGLALHAGQWIQLSLTFLPIFICTGILLSTGILLIRIYHDEIKQKEINYRAILSHSWEIMIGASYFAIPIIFSYLLLWISLGIFVLLSEVPFVGEFFSAVLAFAPFLINLGTLVLCVLSLIILFIVAPIIALKGLKSATIFQIAGQRLEKDIFSNLVLLLLSLIPLAFVVTLLTSAAVLTGHLYLESYSVIQTVVKSFFIMLPFTAFLTPAVIFFFNFAAESHVLMQRNQLPK